MILPGVLYLFLALPLVTGASAHRASVLRPPAAPAAQITYVNREYGFRLTLPHSWKGYTVVTRHDQATDVTVDERKKSDPLDPDYVVITVRHPRWTRDHPREDLPIMIFTLAQWNAVTSEDERLVVSAAPFPPAELSRNANYVFALPPRYNFDYSVGWQELENILKGKPLHGFSVTSSAAGPAGRPPLYPSSPHSV